MDTAASSESRSARSQQVLSSTLALFNRALASVALYYRRVSIARNRRTQTDTSTLASYLGDVSTRAIWHSMELPDSFDVIVVGTGLTELWSPLPLPRASPCFILTPIHSTAPGKRHSTLPTHGVAGGSHGDNPVP